MSHSGACLCGAVSFEITSKLKEVGACHCAMCRKWSGGVYMAVTVPKGAMEISGAENIALYTSSPWAERAFCKACGSNLFYRVTAEGPYQGEYHVGFGSLADASGVPFTGELFIDLKPEAYSFAGDGRHQMTEAEVMALFSGAG